MSLANGAKMKDYLFDKNAGWIPGIVTPSGFAILFLLLIMAIFSHRLVRKSGRFEVTISVVLSFATLPFEAAMMMTYLTFQLVEATQYGSKKGKFILF